MYIDKQTLLSDEQAITVTAASTNIYNMGNDDSKVQSLNDKGNVSVLCQVPVAFAGGTSLKVAFQTSDSSTFSSSTTIYESEAILTAALIQGYKFAISKLPRINAQYLRAYFTVDGTMSAGNIDVGLILDEQTNGA